MLEELVLLILPPIISVCELMGIFVVAVSALRAFWHYCRGVFTHKPQDVKFELANGLATSLEFKMAAEILKTVLVRDQDRPGAGPERADRAGGGGPPAGPALPAHPL